MWRRDRSRCLNDFGNLVGLNRHVLAERLNNLSRGIFNSGLDPALPGGLGRVFQASRDFDRGRIVAGVARDDLHGVVREMDERCDDQPGGPRDSAVGRDIGFVCRGDPRVENVVHAHDQKVRGARLDEGRDVEHEAGESADVAPGGLAVDPDLGDLENRFEFHVHAPAAPPFRCVEAPAVPSEAAEVSRHRKRIVEGRVPGVGKMHRLPAGIVVTGLFRADELGFDGRARRSLTLEAPTGRKRQPQAKLRLTPFISILYGNPASAWSKGHRGGEQRRHEEKCKSRGIPSRGCLAHGEFSPQCEGGILAHYLKRGNIYAAAWKSAKQRLATTTVLGNL